MADANSIASAVSALTSNQPKDAQGKVRQAGKQQLGQDEFLKLLTTQLKAQDPLKPVEDTQFIAQMAQFSSLNQMQTLNKNFESFNKSINESTTMQTLAQASALIGKVVTAGPSMAERAMGSVQQIRLTDGKVQVVLKGVDLNGNTFTDRTFDLGEVQQVGVSANEVEEFQQQTEANLAARQAALQGGLAQAAQTTKIPDSFTPLPEGVAADSTFTGYR